jgi:hypothetical protein
MMDSQILDLLHDRLEAKRKELIEDLGDGVAKDYPAYQNLCGVIRGLLTAQSEINDLLRRMKESEDD